MLDTNEEYIGNFKEYVRFFGGEYSVEFFTEMEALDGCQKRAEGDLIILSQFLLLPYRGKLDEWQEKGFMVMVLSEERELLSIQGIPAVYRYQPADRVMKDILGYCADSATEWEDDRDYVWKKGTKLVSIYSPVGRCGKTGLAVAVGRELADRGWKVLLVSLEGFSSLAMCLGEVQGGEHMGDLSDLLYYYLSGREAIGLKAQSVIRHCNGLDYVPVSSCIRDLRGTKTEKLKEMFFKLGESGRYDVIVADLSDLLEDVYKLLEGADMIIVPGLKDRFSTGKLNQFRVYLQSADYRIDHEAIYELDMSRIAENDLLKSEEGREMIRQIEAHCLSSNDFRDFRNPKGE